MGDDKFGRFSSAAIRSACCTPSNSTTRPASTQQKSAMNGRNFAPMSWRARKHVHNLLSTSVCLSLSFRARLFCNLGYRAINSALTLTLSHRNGRGNKKRKGNPWLEPMSISFSKVLTCLCSSRDSTRFQASTAPVDPRWAVAVDFYNLRDSWCPFFCLR